MRRSSIPCWLNAEGNRIPLRHTSFTDKEFPEAFLQDAIHHNPELLPVDEFDTSFGPLASLGREFEGIDNLFISPNGLITIVETKLWRNPESTREVVAQILDYASRLTGMSYLEFEALCRKAMTPVPIGGNSLYHFVASSFPESKLSETEFVDAVSKTLRTGRFLLLIVGDGIREGLEGILRLLHTHPQHHFTFGLVQLQVFSHPDPTFGKLIVPQVIANTVEIVRATVRVETTGNANVTVGLEPTPEVLPQTRRKLTQEHFIANVPIEIKPVVERILEWCDRNEIKAVPQIKGVSIRLRDPRGDREFTLFVLEPSGKIWADWLPDQLEKAGYDRILADDYYLRLKKLWPEFKPGGIRLDPSRVAEQLENFLNVLDELINSIKSAAK